MFGGISLTNVINRLRSRGVPVTDCEGTYFIAMNDMPETRIRFGVQS